MWRRYCCITELAATTGATIACLVACTLVQAVAPEAALLRLYTPLGAVSRQFMAVFTGSQLLQDALVKQVLVQELWVARPSRLTAEMRKFLEAKVYPPVFSSSPALSAMLLSVWVGGAQTSTFVWGFTDLLVYSNSTVAST